MKLAVVADTNQREELLVLGKKPELQLEFIEEPAIVENAGAYLDLRFENTAERKQQWKNISAPLLFVNAVDTDLEGLVHDHVCINGWPGFLGKSSIEATGPDTKKQRAEEVFHLLNREIEWLPPVTGLVSARIISMIINEAFFALEEGISDEGAIDTAMKLGTNYPFGPFEWAGRIGLPRIYSLLTILSKEDQRYQPSSLLASRAIQP